MLTVYLLCLSVTVVTSNPVFQRLPIQLTQTCPSQTCPSQSVLTQTCPTQSCLPQMPSQTCQACLPKTCSTCQPFSTLPNTMRATPCQSCQNNVNLMPLPLMARQPNCQCNQPVQNVNQPANQEVLNQMVLSKILGPQLQMMLNPNPKVCNQCVPKPKTEVVPNIINNYIIIPPEYFKTNETTVAKNEEVVRKHKGRRRNQKQMANDKDLELDDELLGNVQHFRELNNGARNNHKAGKESSCESDTGINELTNSRSGIRHDGESNPCPCATQVLNEEKSRLLLEKISKFLKNSVNQRNSNNNQDVLLDQTTNIQNKAVETTQRRKNPRVRTFEEAIIKDFCKKNPNIPEEIAWSLLMNIKRQGKNQEISHQYPFGYYLQMLNQNNQVKYKTQSERRQKDRRQKRPKSRTSRRRNKNRQEEDHMQSNKESCDSCEETVELNPAVVNIETETITTEKISTTTDNKVQETVPKKTSETQMETPNDLIDKLEIIKEKFVKLNEIETTTMDYNKRIETYPELGREDKVPTVYDNGVDYYPDFRGDNIAFIASDEELEKYHYTTDRNGVAGERNHKQRYVGSETRSRDRYKIDDSSVYSFPTVEESDENSDETINESVEIKFRTPPSLELPDFETRQINKYCTSEEIDEQFVADKASAYFGKKAKTQENDLQPVKVFSKDNKGRTSVETVLGHSKVVKYGQDVEGAGSSPVITYYLPEEAITEDRIQVPDGASAVVVAKSIRNLKQIWE